MKLMAPGTFGTARPDFCANLLGFDRMSVGQTGHLHRTHGTHPQDGCNPDVELCRQLSLRLLFFRKDCTKIEPTICWESHSFEKWQSLRAEIQSADIAQKKLGQGINFVTPHF